MKFSNIICLLLPPMFMLLSCHDTGTQPRGINPNIILLKSSLADNYLASYPIGVWSGSKVYCVAPLRLLTLDGSSHVINDQLIEDSLLRPIPGYGSRFFRYLSINTATTKLLMVWSLYRDVSIGDLVQVNLVSGDVHVLRDSTYNVSSAVYLPGDSTCIYYSYGHQTLSASPGYYRLNIIENKDSLMLPYQSVLGPREVVNGFDVSPDGKDLIIPVNTAIRTPEIIEYHMLNLSADTIRLSFVRQLLWLRFRPDGKKILYSNYGTGSGGSSTESNTETGIIDRLSHQKRVLDLNTTRNGTSVNPFPNWSSDGKGIIYGSAKGPYAEPPGTISAYSLYILRNVY